MEFCAKEESVNDPKEATATPAAMRYEQDLLNGLDGISRRRFMSLVSASAALALGVSCSRIDRGTLVPYTRRPGSLIPGVAAYYASTFQEGITAHSVLVRTREGRPIHVESGPEASGAGARASLRAMGDLLGLYDPDRARAPLRKGAPASWDDAIKALASALADARLMDKDVLLLTPAIISPTQKALLYDLKLTLPTLHHVAWEPCAPQSALQAARSLYGEGSRLRPHYERARVVAAFQSDFLGADPDASDSIRDFSSRRKVASPSDAMNRLWVVEGGMSLTGANADHRLQVPPSWMARLVFALIGHLYAAHSVTLPEGVGADSLKPFSIESIAANLGMPVSILRLLAEDLLRAGNSALVVAGAALPAEAHIACHLLNRMLGSVGTTVAIERGAPALASLQTLQDLWKRAAAGRYAVGIFWDANPAYAFPDNALWKRAIARIPETFRIGLYEDETALDCAWSLPQHHWLEAWGDCELHHGFVGLRQPIIGALHDTRQAEDLFLSCLRRMKIRTARNYYEYLKSRWRLDEYPLGSPAPFESFWTAALHDGGIKREQPMENPSAVSPDLEAIRNAVASVAGQSLRIPSTATASRQSPVAPIEWDLLLSPGAGVYDGRYANNGWLQELPDPVSKVTWENPVRMSPVDAARLMLKNEDLVRLSNGAATLEAPVLIQPGQRPGVLEIALGYGRRAGNVARGVGANAYPLMAIGAEAPFLSSRATVQRVDGEKVRAIARRQIHPGMEGRNLARSWTMREYSGHRQQRRHAGSPHAAASLVPERPYSAHKWGMVIDLSACVGCSACVIACQSENNIPVVGPEQVRAGRDMHWMRIDRYYEGDPGNPSVRHQPMLCQQCADAPCEIVCPVNATTHSADGLNQMTYNRCIGTRYCSNNCPFKVRRFNFFDYTSMKKEPETFVFNPEVTVRPRGVMEKCTFCVQRIQNAKQQARIENRKIADGEIQPACAAACPAGAIVFGDLNDGASRVAVLSRMDRHYRLLEDLGIKPSITYLADISNPAREG